MLSFLISGLLLSIALGALVGIQRESKLQQLHKRDFAGFRSFTFISILGFLLGYLSQEVFHEMILIYIGFFGIFILIISTYILQSLKRKKIESITSELSGLLVFLVGLLVSLGYYYLGFTISIIITTILFFGDRFHDFAAGLKEKEIFATLKFGIISFLILPLLPNKSYTLLDFPLISNILLNFFPKEILASLDVFNFYNIWLMIVFISAIGYFGYILMKAVGTKKGILLTGFLAGFMSSTAVTSSFALQSKKLNLMTPVLIVGTIIALSTMFLRIIFEVLIIKPEMVNMILFDFLVMGFVGYLIATYLHKKIKIKTHEHLDINSPFTIGPALKFGVFFVFILLVSKILVIFFGSKGVYVLAFFSGVADVDAITISLLNLANLGSITTEIAAKGIILAAFANTLFKGALAYFLGTRKYGLGVIISFILIMFSGFMYILLF